ncbi:MAG: vitamin B12 dependent-methionine synthase activation domain-containing protein [Atopobiaceae bacterium]
MPNSMSVSRYEIPSVDKAEVLRYMGYAGQAYDPSLDEKIDAAIEQALAISDPKGVLVPFEVDHIDEGESPCVHLKDTALALPGHDIQEHLAGAKAAVIFAVTLGMANERELRRLSLTDHLTQILFDAASVALVERTADAAEADAVKWAADQGLFCTWRYSPGYGDLPLSVQPTLLSALNAQRLLGIMLSPSLLMTPTKSVTAIVGCFDTPKRSTHMSCAKCVCHDFCTFRAQGRTCHERRK